MPNYQRTYIRVSGKKEVIDELLKSVVATEEYLAKIEQRNADIPDEFKIQPAELGCVDFNILIPKPDNIYNGDIGDEEKKKYGTNTWYIWNCVNWGTKWNACDDKVVRIDDENIDIHFYTAWNCPYWWFEKFIEKAKELGVEKLEGKSIGEQYRYGFDWNSAVETSEDDEDFCHSAFGFKLQHSDGGLYLQWFRPAKPYYAGTMIFKDKAEFDEDEYEPIVNGCTQEFLDEHNITFEEYDEMLYEKKIEGCFNCWNCENCFCCMDCTNCIDCSNCENCEYCEDCEECNHCINCTKCINCISCEECKKCSDCKECKDCEICHDCENCSRCKICKNYKDIENFYDTLLIFKDYEEFKKYIEDHPDKNNNGCTESFLNKYYDGYYFKWEDDNKTNKKCFNCRGCSNCIDCYECWKCKNCEYCKECEYCKNCKNAVKEYGDFLAEFLKNN